MKRVCLRPVPFCYGPTAIAIAIGKRLKDSKELELVAIGEDPSLDLLHSEVDLFDNIMTGRGVPDAVACDAVFMSDLVISVCDFEFAAAYRALSHDGHLVFVDPLFWMWNEIPAAVNLADLYCALDFPGVRERVDRVGQPNVVRVPQVAEWFGVRTSLAHGPHDILVNLGGMQSPLGANTSLAAAMCTEICRAAESCNVGRVRICTGSHVAEQLRSMTHMSGAVTIESLSKDDFDKALTTCNLLLTVPGMSIIFEAILAAVPTFLLLPLNYSQHLQVAKYRRIFPNFKGVFFRDVGHYSELPPGLSEERGVASAQELGMRFAQDVDARRRFCRSVCDVLSSAREALPLALDVAPDVSGASTIVELIFEHGLL